MDPTQTAPPMVPGSFKLGSTLGAAFIGNIVVAVLYGISCVQIYLYYQRSTKDSRIMKATIFFLWILDTLQLIFWTEALYYLCVTNFFNPTALEYSPWSFLADYIAGLLSDILVTGIYTYRLWRLGKRFIWAQITIQVLSVLVSCATASAFLGLSWRRMQIEVNVRYRWLMLTDFAAKGVGDLCIAISLWSTLRGLRTGVKRTETLIRTLILYSMSTCALTSVSIIGTIIALAAAPHTLIYDAFSIILPKLVFNSLLAFLNSREHFARSVSTNEALSIHLSRMPQSSPRTHKASGNLSPIRVEVSKTTYVDTEFHS